MHEHNVKLPAVFISHGSPMVAIQKGAYQDALAAFARELRPAAIVAISAHWGSASTIGISAAERFEAVHDFGGFPRALQEMTYAPPGDPQLARRLVGLLRQADWSSELVASEGLDHGAWIPLRLMYPEADIPVVPLSVPLQFTPRQLLEVGQILAPLRAENILVLGSGGIVHNLRLFRGGAVDAPEETWAREFGDWFQRSLDTRDLDALLRYEEVAPHAQKAVPTFEHLGPFFLVLGAARDYTRVQNIYEGFQYGSISMHSFALS